MSRGKGGESTELWSN